MMETVAVCFHCPACKTLLQASGQQISVRPHLLEHLWSFKEEEETGLSENLKEVVSNLTALDFHLGELKAVMGTFAKTLDLRLGEQFVVCANGLINTVGTAANSLNQQLVECTNKLKESPGLKGVPVSSDQPNPT